ncbi:MAG: PQQ-like beta-propeller repeat protein [Planctomycetes bacterium]|nr:PQQ-like beta-propeller repeat protein [Planctomycetota bacterium]
MNTRVALLFVFLLVVGAGAQQGESDPPQNNAGPWPQFRGPNGLGVSDATYLPLQWSEESPNIRWVTALPGYGVSSPIISAGRVFVTTSFASRRMARMTLIVRIMGIVLIGLVIVGWALRWRQARQRYQEGIASNWPRNKVIWLEECLTMGLVFGFLALAFCTTMVPALFDRWLDPVGRWVAETYPDLEKLVTIDSGVYAGIWLTGGAMALIGLAAAAVALRGLVWRLFATLAATWAAWWLYQHAPPDEWGEKIENAEKLLFILPGFVLSWLALLGCFEVRGVKEATAPQEPNLAPGLRVLEIHLCNRYLWRAGEGGTILAVLCLLLLVGLVFVPGNYLYADQGIDRAVLCIDQQSGEMLWETVVWTDKPERKHSDNSYATPTCAADGHRVLAFFGGILTCLDYDGKVLWQYRDQNYIRNAKYGSSSSPLIVDDLAIVLQGKEDMSHRPAWLSAFDVHTGVERWRIQPTDIGEGYTTPLIHRLADDTLLLIASKQLLNAYSLKNGQRRWSVPNPIEQIVASLVKSGNILVVGGGTWGPKAIVAMQLSDQANQAPRTLWQAKKGAPGCSSPVILDQRLCLITDTGRFSCYDVRNGKLLWSEGLGGRHLASLVAGAGKVYAVSTKGRTTVIDPIGNRILMRNQLPGKCQATPALAEGCLIQRTGEALYCIEAE